MVVQVPVPVAAAESAKDPNPVVMVNVEPVAGAVVNEFVALGAVAVPSSMLQSRLIESSSCPHPPQR